jgi:phosphatidate phosphatase PAH1
MEGSDNLSGQQENTLQENNVVSEADGIHMTQEIVEERKEAEDLRSRELQCTTNPPQADNQSVVKFRAVEFVEKIQSDSTISQHCTQLENNLEQADTGLNVLHEQTTSQHTVELQSESADGIRVEIPAWQNEQIIETPPNDVKQPESSNKENLTETKLPVQPRLFELFLVVGISAEKIDQIKLDEMAPAQILFKYPAETTYVTNDTSFQFVTVWILGYQLRPPSW